MNAEFREQVERAERDRAGRNADGDSIEVMEAVRKKFPVGGVRFSRGGFPGETLRCLLEGASDLEYHLLQRIPLNVYELAAKAFVRHLERGDK